MPMCQHCKETWSWKLTFVQTLKVMSVLTCPFCKEKQYVTPRTRNITVLITVALVILIFSLYRIAGLTVTTFLVTVGFALLVIVLYPFWMSLSDEEKLF